MADRQKSQQRLRDEFGLGNGVDNPLRIATFCAEPVSPAVHEFAVRNIFENHMKITKKN